MRLASCSFALLPAALPLLLAACGGAQRPAASEPTDTSSLEGEGASHAASSDSSGASPSGGAGGTGSSGGAGGATGGGAASSGPAASSAPADAPAAPMHPAPGATGSLDGKPFAPKLAQVFGPLKKDGRVAVVLHEGSDCAALADAKPGDAFLTLVVPWQDGYKVDLGSLKSGKNGEATFSRTGDDKKAHASATFKPSGRVTVVSAPKDPSSFGKLKIDLQAGDYILAGDLDVKICGALK